MLAQHGNVVTGLLYFIQTTILHAPGTLLSCGVLPIVIPWAAAAVRERDGDMVRAGSTVLTQLVAMQPETLTLTNRNLTAFYTTMVCDGLSVNCIAFKQHMPPPPVITHQASVPAVQQLVVHHVVLIIDSILHSLVDTCPQPVLRQPITLLYFVLQHGGMQQAAGARLIEVVGQPGFGGVCWCFSNLEHAWA